ncbi:FkbM family methyltransferase [Selenomonas sp. KH1T6]|uniref:FkbM family methyltransferase n=1 Tax=Selenomonas sp. KH1T6 TaxID=3158784 RepID=UPI0008A7A08D|nr:methyltransferase, FkbM family [Selenomonas ruminantium]
MDCATYIQQSRQIYKHLCDEESRKIFEYRIMYSITQDNYYVKKMIKTSVQKYLGGETLLKFVDSQRPRYLFGAGYYSSVFLQMWPDNVLAVLDNDSSKWGGTFQGLNILSPQSADFSIHPIFFVTPMKFHQQIKNQLIDMGVLQEDIVDVGAIWEEIHSRQYFDLPKLSHSINEVFADVGSYDGRTSEEFLKWSDGRYKHIYCFEPVQSNITVIKKKFARHENEGLFTLIDKCAGDSKGKICMNMSGNMAGTLYTQEENVWLPTTTLDEELAGKGVTFISMDIEGMELAALKGAENIISKERPQLAISIYHKPEDIFEIPSLLLSYHDDFKFYLRHYFLGWCDTVLYAL